MYRTANAFAIVLLLSFSQATAQSDPSGGMQGPPGGMSGGMSGRMSGGSRPQLPGPEVFEGPPNPPTLRQVADLSEDQVKGYAVVYDSFMLATRPQRDSAATARTALRSAMQSQDRVAAEPQLAILKRQGDYLGNRQNEFDGVLKKLLTGDQYTAYRKYQDDQKQAAQEERRRV